MSWFFFLAVLFVTLPPFFLCFRFPRPFLPNTLTLSFFLAVSFFGVGLLVIVFTALQILSLLVLDVEFSEFLLWNGYTLVFFCGLFLVEHTARSCSFTQSWFWEVYLSISEFRWGCLFVFHFVGQRLFQLRVRSVKNGLTVHFHRTTVFPASSSKNSMFSYSTSTTSQVNSKSFTPYDTSSLSQSRRMCIPRRLLSGGNFIVFTIIRIRS